MTHVSPPSIPVRFNKRTTEKPISMLNGDNLPQLKSIKSSELSPSVLGHNASMNNQMKKLLRQWYSDQQHQIDKLRNAQRQLYKQLGRIHLERRQLQRAMLSYRQEEARTEIERERQRQQREKEQKKIQNEIEKVKGKSSKEADVVKNQNTKVNVVTDIITMTAKVVEVDKKAMQAVVRQKSRVSFENNDSGHQLSRGDAEAHVGDIEPLTRVKSKSFVRENTNGTVKEAPENTNQVENSKSVYFQTGIKKNDEEMKENNDKTITKKPDISMHTCTSKAEEIPNTQRKPMTQVQKNRLRAKKREAESQKLLEEPYSFYRISADGEITETLNGPPKFNTAEPSNREVYENHKRLEAEKAAYVRSMNRLGQHTAKMVNEQVKLTQEFEQVKRADTPDKDIKELNVGAEEWMKVFLRNELPEDLDPDSFEAMQFARYLRPEAFSDSYDDPAKVFQNS